jgi:prevent-host-death family protein
MRMNVSEAKAKLSELMAAAERGEQVVIARGGVPVVRITPLAAPSGLRFGPSKGPVPEESVPDFGEPMSGDELRAWGAV